MCNFRLACTLCFALAGATSANQVQANNIVTPVSGTWTYNSPSGQINFQIYNASQMNGAFPVGTMLVNGLPARYAWRQYNPTHGVLYIQGKNGRTQFYIRLAGPNSFFLFNGGKQVRFDRVAMGIPVPWSLDQWRQEMNPGVPQLPQSPQPQMPQNLPQQPNGIPQQNGVASDILGIIKLGISKL